MNVKHAALLKLKHAALFLIMQLVLGLIMLHVSVKLSVDLARVRLPLIISRPLKKPTPVFLTQLVFYYFSLGIWCYNADRKQCVLDDDQ